MLKKIVTLDSLEYFYKKLQNESGNITIDGANKNNSTTNVIPKPVSSTFYNGKKIAMIGDSITAGVGASDGSKRYTTVLAGLLGATEVNLGASGTVLCTGGHRGCNIGKLTTGYVCDQPRDQCMIST